MPQTVRLKDVIPQTPDTQTLRLDTWFDFKPGQSIQITLPGDEKKRYYSISSSPTEKEHVDITIKAEAPAKLFGLLFQLKRGDAITVSGPQGAFGLPDPVEGPLYFLAGGSGVTPFRSMIKYLLDRHPQTETWLFHSVKTPDDLTFKEEFLAWAAANASFHYVPTFTRSAGDWPAAESGRIGEALLQKHLPLMKGTFFLCGPSQFVTDMERTLKTLQVPAAHIRREEW